MAVMAVWLKINEGSIAPELQGVAETLDSADHEVLLDFATVRRLDPGALRAIEGFADVAHNRGVKVVLRGVTIDAYRVLKLVKLARRFSFVN